MTNSYALPLPAPDEALDSLFFPPTFTANYNFDGIIKLSNCSASLIQFENSNSSDSAVVMTNGHCLGGGSFLKPDQFVVNQASARTITLLNNQGTSAGSIQALKVLYATMTGTDVSLYQVKPSYDEIRAKYGVLPLTLSSEHPTAKSKIDIISGYWTKGYTCDIDGFVYNLKEDAWTWTDSIRYSQPGCETIHGTSGSPVLAHGTKTIIGINNTGNDNGEKCTMDNPCEVDENGNITFEQGRNYGQQTYWIYSCLNENNEIDLSIEGCKLTH